MKNNIKHYEKGKEVKNKPLINCLTHISDLNIDSKKQISSFDNEENNSYLKNINIFNIRNENINGVDISNHEEENQFLNSEYINTNANNNINKPIKISNNPFNLNKEPAKDIKESEVMKKNKINNNRRNITQQQNKKILQNQKKQKKIRKNKKKQRNISRSYSTINNNLNKSNKSNMNSKRNKSSQYSDRSGNSTKRTNYILRTHDSPEKYPDDYLTVDSSSDEEKEVKKKEFQFYTRSSLYKDILENSNIYDPRKSIEKELERFDLMTIDVKKLYKDKKFKNKYFKSIKAEIKVVNFNEKILPLHAIFIFNETNLFSYNIINQEKKLFPGAYSKEEFVNIFTNAIKNKNCIKVELLMDYVDMSRYQDYTWIGINPFSLNDFYILVEIIE